MVEIIDDGEWPLKTSVNRLHVGGDPHAAIVVAVEYAEEEGKS